MKYKYKSFKFIFQSFCRSNNNEYVGKECSNVVVDVVVVPWQQHYQQQQLTCYSLSTTAVKTYIWGPWWYWARLIACCVLPWPKSIIKQPKQVIFPLHIWYKCGLFNDLLMEDDNIINGTLATKLLKIYNFGQIGLRQSI